ncbi:IS701 family transposase [Streptomyces daliensis]
MSKPESRLQHTVPSAVADELASDVFASLPRSDQRRKARQYVRGLLEAEGRKSIRKIAALTGERAAEQSLQHFVSCSTWPWDVVRATLARRMEAVVRPSAWVVRPLVIPKAGSRSVGVGRRLVPELGQVINCQRAYGVWLANDAVSWPAHWRLDLPASWTDDPTSRREADLPDWAAAESPSLGIARAAVEMAEGGWGLARRPVVLDAGDGGDDGTGAAVLAAAGLPFIARISGTAGVVPTDAPVPGRGRGLVPAHEVMCAVRGLRRPVEWLDPEGAPLRTSLAAKVPVTVRNLAPYARTGVLAGAGPGPGAGAGSGGVSGVRYGGGAGSADGRVPGPRRGHGRVAGAGGGAAAVPGVVPGRAVGAMARPGLCLLGEWEHPYRWPVRFWLTDLVGVPAGVLLRLTKLTRRVDRDLTEVADAVGVRDFEGRTFPGWHRHTTLTSVAHGAAVLATARGARVRSGAPGPRSLPGMLSLPGAAQGRTG